MRPTRACWLCCVLTWGALLLALPSLALAEQLTVAYTEPTASGTLARTTIYWCMGATCTDWREATLPNGSTARQASDDGNGGDAKSIPILIELRGGTLPQTVRIKVDVTDTSGNTTAGAITSHTFNP
jgi:hypothetical protein